MVHSTNNTPGAPLPQGDVHQGRVFSCPECGAYDYRDEQGRLVTVCNLLHSPADCSECNRSMIEAGRKLRAGLIASMAAELGKPWEEKP